MSNEPQSNRSAGDTQAAYQPCLCRETLDHLRKVFRLSPDVTQHLTNSRIEFLRAIQALINARIEHLSRAGQPGTKIAVE